MAARGRPEAPSGGTGNNQRSTVMKKKKNTKRLAPEQDPPTNEPDLKKLKAEVEEDEEEETNQELTLEEKRTLERKLKKERKKEEKKSMREAGMVTKKEEVKKPSASELSLDYLTSWSENPDRWKFQKTRQTWLLLHMYNNDKVPDEYFSILLQYLEGLQGSARSVTIQKAEALMKEYDTSETEDSSLLETRERIRKVLQLLS